ncbi:MAG: creatininase family protein [Planctomycetota bacterium]|jgi:creatinine amidohydrolase
MSDGILMEMTVEDVEAFDPDVVVLGVGSTEAHGPHLPYGTDYYATDATVRRGVELANQRGARALMYPTLAIGNNVNCKARPFVCRIGVQTLMQVLLDVMTAVTADGVRKIVLWNGHGGNTDAIHATLRAFADGQPVDGGAFACVASTPGEVIRDAGVTHSSCHGGESETARMMHLHPNLVRTDKLDNFPFGRLAVDALDAPSVYFVRPWHRVVPASAGGETRESKAEVGKRMFEGAAEYLADLLVGLSKAPWSDAFPYEP